MFTRELRQFTRRLLLVNFSTMPVTFAATYLTTRVLHLTDRGLIVAFGVAGVISTIVANHIMATLEKPRDVDRGNSLPVNAEYLFYLFLDAKNCDAILGDLEERYRIIHRKFGVGRARFWYWTMAIRSVGPLAWAWMKKIVMKVVIPVIAWAVAKGIISHDSWIAALVELYRRIRS